MIYLVLLVVFAAVFLFLLTLQTPASRKRPRAKPVSAPAIPPLLPALFKKREAPEAAWPYRAKKPLSNPELELYGRLCRALPGYIVLAQVGLSRILNVNKDANFGEWHNRISQMSVDFVLCAPDGAIIAVIELDDRSHLRADRQAADAKKDKALAAAGIPIVRWNVKAMPDERTIQYTFIRGVASSQQV